MSHRILRYYDGEDDDVERFAVWSTTVEDWIAYDMNDRQLREWYFGQQMEEARKHIKGRIFELRNGKNPYQLWDADAKRKELKEELRD